MASVNKVILIGNLTRDPEMKVTPKGTQVAEFGLAINRNYTADNGEKREEVTFIDVTLWGRIAEIVGEYCKKGRPLYVEGRLHLDTWDDKTTGQKRSKVKVIGESIQLLNPSPGHQPKDEDDPRDKKPPGEYRQASAPPPRQPPASQPAPDFGGDSDDIPF